MQQSPFNPIFLTLLLTGIGFLIGSVLLSKYPPKHINGLYGYRTPRAIRSAAAWAYAQIVAAKQLKLAAISAIGLSPIGFLFSRFNDMIQLCLAILFTVLITGVPIILTEKALKEKFDE